MLFAKRLIVEVKRFLKFKKKPSNFTWPETSFYKEYIQDNQNRFNECRTDLIKLRKRQQSNEFTWRFDQRYQQVVQCESLLTSDDYSCNKGLRNQFVNYTESYYQGFYAALSAFIHFFESIAPHDFRRGLKTSSVETFFNQIESRFSENDEILKSTRILREALQFRTRIDHVQQHALHNWLTYSFPSEHGFSCVIIYFIESSISPQVGRFSGVYNPYSAHFNLPLGNSGFYTSPSLYDTHKAFFDFCKLLLVQIDQVG